MNQEITQEQANQQSKEIWDQLEQEEQQGAAPVTRTDDAGTATDTTAAPAQKAAAEAAADSGAAPGDDRQALLDTVEGLRAQMAQMQARLRNAEGHVGGLNNTLQRLQAAAAEAKQNGEPAPTAKQVADAAGDEDAMKKLLEDYPELGSTFKRALEGKIEKVRTELAATLKPAAAAPPEGYVSRAEFERIQRELPVEIAHPGWTEHVKTPGFTGWLQRQPREVQLLAGSDNPRDAIRLLDLEKQARQKPATSKTPQHLESAARLPTGRGGPQARSKPDGEKTAKEIWDELDQLERAQART